MLDVSLLKENPKSVHVVFVHTKNNQPKVGNAGKRLETLVQKLYADDIFKAALKSTYYYPEYPSLYFSILNKYRL